MDDRQQTRHAGEPTDTALREAIRALSGQEPASSRQAMLDDYMLDFMLVLERARSRLEAGASSEQAVAELIFHGLERERAETIVEQAAGTLGYEGLRHEAVRGPLAANDWLTRFAILVIVLLAMTAYLYTAG